MHMVITQSLTMLKDLSLEYQNPLYESSKYIKQNNLKIKTIALQNRKTQKEKMVFIIKK